MAFEQQILRKLESIEGGINEIKQHMVDVDTILTEEDYEALINYREEKETGKLVSHKQLKKELRL